MKSAIVKLCLAAGVGLVLTGCPTSGGPTDAGTLCNASTCANGCCGLGGQCMTANDNATCGLNAAACSACGSGSACNGSGLCVMTADAGTMMPADSGTTVDAGNPCVDSPGDAVLGTLTTMGTAAVAASGALPEGIIVTAEVGGALYGLNAQGALISLGTLPNLTLGQTVGYAVPADQRDAGVFISGYLPVSGTQVLAGFTDPSFGGKVAVINVADGGTSYFNAPGNYTAAALGSGFIVNGTGLGSLTGTGLYALRPGAMPETALLVALDGGLDVGGSGYTAVTSDGVLLAGYASSTYENFVRAVPAAAYTTALTGGTSVSLTPAAPLVDNGNEIAWLDAVGTNAIVVRGAYDNSFNPYTIALRSVPLTLSGASNDTVTVGTAATLLQENGSRCTRILFTSGSASSLYLGVQDARGRRLVKLTP